MKRSKIDQLPPDIRAGVDQELVRRSFSGFNDIVSWLAGLGYEVSRSTIGRRSQKVQRKTEMVWASTEAARAIAGITDEEDERSAAVISLVQSEMFELLLNLQEAQEETDAAERVKLLSGAARAIADLSRASVSQKKWAQTVREKVQEKLEQLKEPSADRKAIDPDTLDYIREQIYGVI